MREEVAGGVVREDRVGMVKVLTIWRVWAVRMRMVEKTALAIKLEPGRKPG